MAKTQPVYRDDEPVDEFRFKNFGEMREVLGTARATSLLTALKKKGAAAKAQEMDADDIKIARILSGLIPAPDDKPYGRQASKALKAYRNFFAADATARASLKRFLDKAEARLNSNGTSPDLNSIGSAHEHDHEHR